MDSDKLIIGSVLKPQGVVGELKLKNYSDGLNAVKNISVVFIDGVEYKVLNIRGNDDFLFITISGVYDRNAAELLRAKDVFALRSEIVKAADQYFVSDVIGCDLYLSSGKNLGKIIDIAQSNVDVYSVDTLEGTAIFPMLKILEPIFDIENKKVTVDAKKFTEVVMYEN